MKSRLVIEYNELNVDETKLIKAAKECWLKKGNKIKDIDSIDLYLKPAEKKCYYVIKDCNGTTENDCFEV